MNVEKLATKLVVTVDSSATITEAANQMRNQHVGALVVTDPSGDALKAIGVITDRDLVVSVIALGLDPKILTAGDVMSTDLLVAKPGDDASATIQHMRRAGVRRVPVVDDNGHLVGLFALDDYLDHLAFSLREVTNLIAREQEEEEQSRLAFH